ncbi:MAG: class I SAM-dependent methyltransferase [Moorea sp. SIOASIH]|uniref:class I SAM-dependent methyltransferase n=1 Tax=unclassified Moorena TaxID=2683338 RepID=UPI0013BCD970|nr:MULTISPECIES: class I SAM-dependent methyltransferase [unclassified Moorena]NEO40916.1 class I SAM-dependent methyltransferase [Moorena sp. SIOASIH]NEO79897.1 class I SAM-dependent methyltransferase [Moorena sp. SIO4G3]NEO90202.1 class I SAM-dependent methyltransferase [Moorena sp. SIO3G5]
MTTNYDPKQWDKVCDAFKEFNKEQITYYIAQKASFVKGIGEIEGKTVLDVGCGSGSYTQLLKEKGAAKVVGVDISVKMVEVAREQEAATPLGIEYHVLDAAEMPKLGNFDLITAVSLFNYAKDREHLKAMFRNIYENMAEGGRLVALIMEPNFSGKKFDMAKYEPGITISKEETLPDGRRAIQGKLEVNPPVFVDLYLYDRSVYESAINEAGFKNLTWEFNLEVPPEAIEKYGQSYWQNLLDNPLEWLLFCDK